jgi:hypothetical protein
MSLKSRPKLKRRDFTKEFKLKVLAELDGGMGMEPQTSLADDARR